MEEENNNFTSSYQVKQFELDENIMLFAVNIQDLESIESLIEILTELEYMNQVELNNG
jgi:hypothetical protein